MSQDCMGGWSVRWVSITSTFLMFFLSAFILSPMTASSWHRSLLLLSLPQTHIFLMVPHVAMAARDTGYSRVYLESSLSHSLVGSSSTNLFYRLFKWTSMANFSTSPLKILALLVWILLLRKHRLLEIPCSSSSDFRKKFLLPDLKIPSSDPTEIYRTDREFTRSWSWT